MFATILSSALIVAGVLHIVLEQAAGFGLLGVKVTPDLERNVALLSTAMFAGAIAVKYVWGV